MMSNNDRWEAVMNHLKKKDCKLTVFLSEAMQQLEYPQIIRTDGGSLTEVDKKNIIENLKKTKFSFFNNSSIWIRFVENDDQEGGAVNEVNWFKDLGLYDFPAAREYFDSQMRLHTQNYLEVFGGGGSSGSGHMNYITPLIYSNEVDFRDFFFDNNSTITFKYLRDSNVEELFERALILKILSNEELNMLLSHKGELFFYKGSLQKELNENGTGNLVETVNIKKYYCSINELQVNGLKKLESTHDFKAENVALRILLVDDKLGDSGKGGCAKESGKETGVNAGNNTTNSANKVFDCIDDCSCCSGRSTCKLRVIKKLMSGDFIQNNHDKQITFRNKTYWADEVTSFCVDKLRIADIWEYDGNNKLLPAKSSGVRDELNKKLINKRSVQIIGVRDLESALTLMSYCKFDIIMLDYLLGVSPLGSNKRTYSTELFEFLSFKFKNSGDVYKPLNTCPDLVNILAEGLPVAEDSKMRFLEQFRENVKLNRGPLDKYWIVPMTSYNSSFLTDMQRGNVRLIDHRWNISQGADPINTPWRFLYKLNEFVDLQLRSSVFWKKQLMTFVQYTCEDFRASFEKTQKKDGSCFEEFQQFMGAEYANFMKRYGARKLIERDAVLYADNSNKSLFATYIAKNFYNDTKYSIETELNRMMQNFYHWAAIMFNDRFGHQRMRIAFERMRVFIAYNKLEEEAESSKELLYGLRFLHAVIDSEFDCRKINDWLENNKE